MNSTARPTATSTYEDAPDEWTPAGYHVRVTWEVNPPVDRPDVGGFLLRNGRTASRLVRAINDGAVFYDAEVETDINGQTYVSARCRVLCRYANADLKRLGY